MAERANNAMPMTGADIVAEAFEAFDRWCAENDPDGEMDVLDQADAYSRSTLAGVDHNAMPEVRR